MLQIFLKIRIILNKTSSISCLKDKDHFSEIVSKDSRASMTFNLNIIQVKVLSIAIK
jgi:hypothetical protein